MGPASSARPQRRLIQKTAITPTWVPTTAVTKTATGASRPRPARKPAYTEITSVGQGGKNASMMQLRKTTA